jgi:hypothetical protein
MAGVDVMGLVQGDSARALGWSSALQYRARAVLVAAVVAAGSTTACSSGSADGAAADAGPASTAVRPSSGPAVGSTQPPGPTPTPAPSEVVKVIRRGPASTPTITAAPAAFAGAVSYPDGLELTVDEVESAVESGQGPGVFAGREFAVFTVGLRNGTRGAIDVQQVVVTATYGPRYLVAERVYANDARAVDFGGSINPGASATARYAFAVPAAQLGDVRLVVDVDGIHTSAQFRGDTRPVS